MKSLARYFRCFTPPQDLVRRARSVRGELGCPCCIWGQDGIKELLVPGGGRSFALLFSFSGRSGVRMVAALLLSICMGRLRGGSTPQPTGTRPEITIHDFTLLLNSLLKIREDAARSRVMAPSWFRFGSETSLSRRGLLEELREPWKPGAALVWGFLCRRGSPC